SLQWARAISSSSACTLRTEPGGTSSTRATVTKPSCTVGDTTKGLSSERRPRYAAHVATILLCGVDVYFRGKLEALLPAHRFVTTDSADWPDLVIADISRVDPVDVADSYPEVPILGYGGHA